MPYPTCANCGTTFSGPYKFCPECGAPAAKTCANCGTENQPGAKFCTECGTSLLADPQQPAPHAHAPAPPLPDTAIHTPFQSISSEGERRRITVMLADVSGYTALNEALDPEMVGEMADRIKEIATRCVTRHDGLVNQIIGDEVLALFGLGNDDNAALSAVRTAVEIREELKRHTVGADNVGRVAMHFGICSGLLVIRPSSDREGVFSVTGDAVNTAARLLSLAKSDEIVISPDDGQAIAPHFGLRQMDEVSLKGKALPLAPFEVLDERALRSNFELRLARGLGRFVGREEELAQLEKSLQHAMRGWGQIATVSAHAGVGKSRLVHEFLEQEPSLRKRIFIGHCAPNLVDVPYSPWAEIAGAMIGETLDSADKVSALTHDFGLPASDTAALSALLGLGGGEESGTLAHVPHELRPQMIRDATVRLIQAACRTPTIIWLEDWHWADPESRKCLDDLSHIVASLPLLLLASFRPEDKTAWPSQDNVHAVRLMPFDQGSTMSMLAAMFPGAQVPEEVAESLYERTQGNALFVEEIVHVLRDDGTLRETGGVVAFTHALTDIKVPDTVQSAILRRMDRIDPDWREVLRRAAVVGRDFDAATLAAITPPGIDLDRALKGLLGMDFIVWWGNAGDANYSFKHVITQEVAYNTLLHKQRKKLHEAVGQALETAHANRIDEHCDELAFHYARSDNSAKALEFLEQAGDRAAAHFALASARKHYSAAIGLLEEATTAQETMRRIELSEKIAAASQFATSEWHVALMKRAIADADKLGREDLAATCRYWMGRMYYGLGMPVDAIAAFEAALALSTTLGDADLAARCRCVIGRACLFTAEAGRGLENLKTGIEAMQHLGRRVELAYSMSSMGAIQALTGDFHAAEESFGKALRFAREQKNRSDEALVFQQMAFARCTRGAWDEAIDAAEECIVLSQKAGLPLLLLIGRVYLAFARAHGYDLEEGHRQMAEAIADYEASEANLVASVCHGWYAELAALCGDHQAARRHAEISLGCEEVGDKFGQLAALRALAASASADGDLQAARDYLQTARSRAEERGVRPDAGKILLRQAALETDSAGLRDAALALFEVCDMPWWADQAARLPG